MAHNNNLDMINHFSDIDISNTSEMYQKHSKTMAILLSSLCHYTPFNTCLGQLLLQAGILRAQILSCSNGLTQGFQKVANYLKINVKRTAWHSLSQCVAAWHRVEEVASKFRHPRNDYIHIHNYTYI